MHEKYRHLGGYSTDGTQNVSNTVGHNIIITPASNRMQWLIVMPKTKEL